VQVVTKHLAPLLKESRIGPAIDFDVFLLTAVHEFMEGRCPVDPTAAPRRIADGRGPTLSNIAGRALPGAATAEGASVGGRRLHDCCSRGELALQLT